MDAPAPSQPEVTGNHRAPNHDGDIGQIKDPCVNRAYAENYEIIDEAMASNAVNQVAHPTGPNQPKANEYEPSKPTSKYEIHRHADQRNADTDGKYSVTRRLWKRISKAKK
jgi:histidinol phosphatase-like PHP family hydrolase